MSSNGVAALSREVADLRIDDVSTTLANTSAFEDYNSEPPPAPQLRTRGLITMDITEQFTYAAQKLEEGQLVKDAYFTLFESVATLEIMDRKMDSGYLEPGESMEDEYDFSQDLLPEEIIGIIDQLICHEMAWHMGHPLSQTIFTSLYIDRLLSPTPLTLDQTYFDRREGFSSKEPLSLQILRAYCLGLVKTCFYVNSRVQAEHYYEEEDFVTHTFNRSLLERLDDESILQLLDQTINALSGSETISADIKNALNCRLRFREKFLRTVQAAESRTRLGIQVYWTGLLALLPNIQSSSKLGKTLPASFSVKLQRKLASTVPPRPIVEISQDAAFTHLERLCQDGSDVFGVFDYFDSHSLMTFVSLFQARKPQPSVYIRTLLQYYLFADMTVLGKFSVRQVLDGDLASIVLPAHVLLAPSNDEIEVPNDPRFNMADRMEIFRSRAASVYLDIYRTICQNRCRIRRTLCHTIADWDNLQLDAEELDHDLQQFTKEEPVVDHDVAGGSVYAFPLSSWAYFYKLRQMEWIVQIGFELETYQPDELAGMYWYLQYLAKTRTRHLERIRGFVIRSLAAYRRSSKTSESYNKDFANAISFINFSTMEGAATYGFADSLSCLFTVLNRLCLIRSPERRYSDNHLRYEVRMKPFLGIGLPEVIPFDHLTQMVTAPDESTLDILNFAAESALGAKKGLEVLSKLSAKDAYCQGSHESWLKNIKNCLKACIFTSITIATVKKAVETAGKDGEVGIKLEIPVTGKGYHDWWVVPKVTTAS